MENIKSQKLSSVVPVDSSTSSAVNAGNPFSQTNIPTITDLVNGNFSTILTIDPADILKDTLNRLMSSGHHHQSLLELISNVRNKKYLDINTLGSVLMYAFSRGRKSIFEKCLELNPQCIHIAGPNNDSVYLQLLNSLREACNPSSQYAPFYNDYLSYLDIFLSHKDFISIEGDEGWSPLVAACEMGIFDVVQKIHAVRPDFFENSNDKQLVDAFLHACGQGHLDVVRYIVSIQPDIVFAKHADLLEGRTGLMLAIGDNCPRIVDYLVDYIVENCIHALDVESNSGITAEFMIISLRNSNLFSKIIKKRHNLVGTIEDIKNKLLKFKSELEALMKKKSYRAILDRIQNSDNEPFVRFMYGDLLQYSLIYQDCVLLKITQFVLDAYPVLLNTHVKFLSKDGASEIVSYAIYAARKNNTNALKLILEKIKAEKEKKERTINTNSDSNAPVSVAQVHDNSMIAVPVDNPDTPSAVIEEKENLVNRLISKGHISLAQSFKNICDQKETIFILQEDKDLLLCLAADLGHVAIAKILIDAGANIEAKSPSNLDDYIGQNILCVAE